MPRISKYPLDKVLEAEMFRQFWRSVAKLRNAHEVASFFSDLLTNTEEVMLAKRFAIGILLLGGKKPVEIATSIKVSFTTIASVAAWLKNAKPKTEAVFARIMAEKEWEALVDRVGEILDRLPPVYGTNWSAAGRATQRRMRDRSLRKSLR